MAHMQRLVPNEKNLYMAYKRKSTGREDYWSTFHAHQSMEILIIHEGKGTLIVDQKSYEVASGMLCVFQPYQLHHIQMEITPETPFVRSVIHFEPYLYEPYFEKWPRLLAFYKHLYSRKHFQPCMRSDAEQFSFIQHLLDNNRINMSRIDELEGFSLFFVTLLNAMKTIWEGMEGQTGISSARTPHQVERILVWLEEHYTEPLRLKKMAVDLSLSPYHLSHLFKECTGSSISDYLNARRMQEAIKLLVATDDAVARIGESIGIAGCSYFCKMFKTHFGITPHQFRKNRDNKRTSRHPPAALLTAPILSAPDRQM